jgi:hypothetical protein
MFRSLFTMLSSSRPVGSRAKRATFKPQLETMENRLVPTVSLHVSGSDAYVDGDYWGNDNLTIRAFGDGSYKVEDNAGHSVMVNGAGMKLHVSTHWGNDTVRYVTGDFNSATIANFAPSDVDVDLGEGNDKFTGTFNKDIGFLNHVILNVHGSGGDDMIAVYGQPVAPKRSGDNITDGKAINTDGLFIDGSSSLEVGLFGDGGNDKLFFNYDGQLMGNMDMELDGGSGNDQVEARANIRAGSLGVFGQTGAHGVMETTQLARVDGSSGNDKLIFAVADHSNGHVDINAVIRGRVPTDFTAAFDYDKAKHTSNVNVLQCDSVILL